MQFSGTVAGRPEAAAVGTPVHRIRHSGDPHSIPAADTTSGSVPIERTGPARRGTVCGSDAGHPAAVDAAVIWSSEQAPDGGPRSRLRRRSAAHHPRTTPGGRTVIARLVIGLAMTVLALAVSGRRAFWLYKLISSGQPAHDRTDGARASDPRPARRGVRSAQAAEMVRPGARPFLHVLGVRHSQHGVSRGLRRAVRARFPHSADRPLVGARFPAGLHRRGRADLARRVLGDPAAQRPGAPGAAPRGSTARTPAAPG